MPDLCRRFTVTACAALALTGASLTGASRAEAAEPPGLPAVPDTVEAGRCTPASPTVVAQMPWAQLALAPQRAWALTRGAGVLVAVVDTGVDGRIPALAGAVSDAPADCVGHGTFVAGLIAARPRAGSGFVGVAPDARIVGVRAGDANGSATLASLARGIVAGVDAGARIVNVSASTPYPGEELRRAVDYAAAHDVLVVASAANGAEEGNPASYPAAYPGVLAVGAIDPNGARAGFSQVGPYVDLVAPGVSVVSVGPGGEGHLVGTGTSFATAFVSGAAALVRAYHPTLTAAQVSARLTETANHPAGTRPDPQVGHGTVDPYAAVSAVLPAAGATPAARPAVPAVRPAAAPAAAGPDRRALAVVAGATGVALLAGAIGALVPRGRRRGWRA